MLCPSQLEKLLTYEKFVEWTHPNRMNSVEVEVELPRFKMAKTCDLKDVLKSMGMVDAFDVKKSDFSGETCNTFLLLFLYCLVLHEGPLFSVGYFYSVVLILFQ